MKLRPIKGNPNHLGPVLASTMESQLEELEDLIAKAGANAGVTLGNPADRLSTRGNGLDSAGQIAAWLLDGAADGAWVIATNVPWPEWAPKERFESNQACLDWLIFRETESEEDALRKMRDITAVAVATFQDHTFSDKKVNMTFYGPQDSAVVAISIVRHTEFQDAQGAEIIGSLAAGATPWQRPGGASVPSATTA